MALPDLRIYTLGAVGRTGDEAMALLEKHRIDVFVDVRMRRGMRGATYAWTNRQRLEAALADRGIPCVHAKAFGAPAELRALQAAADKRAGVGKRDRRVLDPAFVTGYRDQVLAGADVRAVLDPVFEAAGLVVHEGGIAGDDRASALNDDDRSGAPAPPPSTSRAWKNELRICLFCAESAPEACHRSLLAEWLAAATGAPVIHL